jgi:transcriptional regulator with XRE-family HTH domain
MNQALDHLNKLTGEFDATFRGDDAGLRLDLAEIIWRGLKQRGWSQRRLAQESGLADAVVSNIMHGNRNWRCATAARILHALGTKARLIEAETLTRSTDESRWRVHSANGEIIAINPEEHTRGEEITFHEATTAP